MSDENQGLGWVTRTFQSQQHTYEWTHEMMKMADTVLVDEIPERVRKSMEVHGHDVEGLFAIGKRIGTKMASLPESEAAFHFHSMQLAMWLGAVSSHFSNAASWTGWIDSLNGSSKHTDTVKRAVVREFHRRNNAKQDKTMAIKRDLARANGVSVRTITNWINKFPELAPPQKELEES